MFELNTCTTGFLSPPNWPYYGEIGFTLSLLRTLALFRV